MLCPNWPTPGNVDDNSDEDDECPLSRALLPGPVVMTMPNICTPDIRVVVHGRVRNARPVVNNDALCAAVVCGVSPTLSLCVLALEFSTCSNLERSCVVVGVVVAATKSPCVPCCVTVNY